MNDDRLKKFARWVIQQGVWSGFDLDRADIQEKALSLGLIECVSFDPDKHDASEQYGFEPGDDWYVFSAALSDSAIPGVG